MRNVEQMPAHGNSREEPNPSLPTPSHTPNTTHLPHKSNFALPPADAERTWQWGRLLEAERSLEQSLGEARQEMGMMQDLFRTLERAERGEQVVGAKGKRRSAEELAVRHNCPFASCSKFYSVESTLQRHIKLKHRSIKTDPPQLYHDLQPFPNLTNIYDSSSDSEQNDDHRVREAEGSQRVSLVVRERVVQESRAVRVDRV